MITVPLTSNPTSNATASPFQHPGSRQRIDRQVLSETVSGLRISAVDGTAFIDNAADLSAYCDGNHQITITDSADKKLVGVLGSAGSGETLGSELFPALEAANFDSVSATWTIPGDGTAISAGGTGTIVKNLSVNYTGILARARIAAFDYSSGVVTRPYISGAGAWSLSSNATLTQTFTELGASPNRFQIFSNGFNGKINNISYKQVTSPSTTGALITASPTGAQSFTSKDADFAYNAASYAVTVKRIYL